MPYTAPLDRCRMQSDGAGRWYGRCHCLATTPSIDAHDDLRLMAVAQAAGWRAERRDDGLYDLVCPRCVRRNADAAQT